MFNFGILSFITSLFLSTHPLFPHYTRIFSLKLVHLIVSRNIIIFSIHFKIINMKNSHTTRKPVINEAEERQRMLSGMIMYYLE